MQKALKSLRPLDWTLAIGTLGVGAYLQDPLIASAGALGLLLAWYAPAERIRRTLERRLVRKTAKSPSHTSDVSSDDAFYGDVAPVAVAVEPKKPNFSNGLRAGQLYLHSSHHNLLRPEVLLHKAGDRSNYLS